MILYGTVTSPYVRHLRVALAQFGLDYDFVETNQRQSAKQSPSKRVPYLIDGDRKLTDSSSILLYIKQKAGELGFADVVDFDIFCLANTALDAEINLFFMARDNVTEDNSAYMKRQRARVGSTLAYLDSQFDGYTQNNTNLSDGELRLACFLSWGLFRHRFAIDGFDNLKLLLAAAQNNPHFVSTAPPT